jgi:phage-related protein
LEKEIKNIIKTKEAQKDYIKLEKFYQEILDKEYNRIEKQNSTKGIYIKNIKKEIFEIKTGDLRSLFAFKNDNLIIVAVIFIKKSQKTPEILIKRATKIIERWEKENER